MPRLPDLSDLKKNWRKRASVWLVGLICLLLLDEYIKEGYFFDVKDILIPGTHEFLVVVLTVILAFLTALGFYR